MKPETKYKGSIKLSTIGDALGWITEFERNTKSLFEKFGTEQINSFYAWKKQVGGRFYGFVDHIDAGSYSDDTQLMLAVARSVKKGGDVDHEYFAKVELANWLDYARGGGRTVRTAADKISRKSIKWFNNFYSYKVNDEIIDYKQSGANGAAMRVLPIALANLGNLEKIKGEIFCNSIITHGHPRAILGAMLYGYAVNQIIVFRPEDFNWEHYITQIGIDFTDRLALSFIKREEIQEWQKIWNSSSVENFENIYAVTLAEAQSQLRLIFQSIKQGWTVQDTLRKIGCFDPSTKGSGIATVIAGIYLAAKFNEKPLDAIIEAVNALGADTDSIAAFTGGLIGALHGQGIIPEKWKSVQDIDYLDMIAERLLAISEDGDIDSSLLAPINLKQLNNLKADDFHLDEFIEFAPLGKGRITAVDRQPTLTKGKYNLLVSALFDCGQSILISKLLDDPNYSVKASIPSKTKTDEVLRLAAESLKPNTLEKLGLFIASNKKLSQDVIEIIYTLLKNES